TDGTLNLLTAQAQSTERASNTAFEVASIKLNSGCAGGPKRVSASGGRLELSCVNLKNAIETAYGVFANGRTPNLKPVEVAGGPHWIDSDLYEIIAKAVGTPAAAQMQGPMLQQLLEERFKLRLHRDTKTVPVYALTVAKGGPKMKASKEGTCTQVDI